MAKFAKEDAFAAFDEGKKPSDLKGKGLSNKALYNYFGYWKKDRDIAEGSPQGSPQGSEKPSAVSPAKATRLAFVPKTLVVDYTPTMLIARDAAIREWHVPEDTRFDDFLDAILSQFFEDRGITLAGYIVRTKEAEDGRADRAKEPAPTS
jgi:hypothetical protein